MHRNCGNVLRTGSKRHVMKYVGRRKGGEIRGTHGGGTKT